MQTNDNFRNNNEKKNNRGEYERDLRRVCRRLPYSSLSLKK